ncbi:DUF6089 family protein [Paracrocinitomix mangrovi]|uniref:DUF6089 family protein n=1 Tax=Paracrocinitomix mangrovi TaxID=2862509 RepID=UPI001C8E32C6|nr:DUF6089 family protein [Paracrocinitomix mangrovi]UKN01576.1 DUF6089 family protein [Paracrocinitomix mangrovi]
MKKLLILFIALGLSTVASAQRYNLGFGMRAGVTNFLGDIGGGDEARNFVYNMELADTRWAVGPFINYRFHPLFAINGSITYARLQGMDSNSENRARRGRNLNFTNDIFDISAKFEYYPQILSVSDVGFRGMYQTDYQTYFFAGLGTVIHGPKGQYMGTGDKIRLRPLMTEGVKYSPVAFQMPFGGGFFFTHKRQHRIGFEFQWSWTFTDYLDDISTVYVDPSQMSGDPVAAMMANQYINQVGVPAAAQYGPGSPRGDPTDRDNYMLMTVSYSYLIRTRNGFYRRNYSWMYGRRRRFGGTKAKF